MGELLFRISGVSGKPDEDDEGDEDRIEDGSNEQTRKALVDTLGKDRRDRVFAALYIVRQDSTGVVRQAAIHVWKALVQNTPRTVREILPILSKYCSQLLALQSNGSMFPSANHRSNPCQSWSRTARGKP